MFFQLTHIHYFLSLSLHFHLSQMLAKTEAGSWSMRFLGNTYSISNSMFFFRLFQQRTECLVEAAQNNVCKGCRGLPADIPSSYWGASRLGLHATAERGVTAYVLGGTTDWIDNYVQIRPVAPNKDVQMFSSNY